VQALSQRMAEMLSADAEEMGRQSLKKIRGYTIEAMAQAHEKIFANPKKGN